MRWVVLLLLCAVPQEPEVRFTYVDVYVDAGKSQLAAYQFELTTEATLVGVEGGDVEQFKKAPYYDPAALQGGRIIIAAFTTDKNAPSGRIRVARIHVQETGAEAPAYTSILMVAAAPGGKKLDAKIEVVEAGRKK